MKKILLLLIVSITIVSCKNNTPIDYAIISGKIENTEKKEMTLRNDIDKKFKKKIKIAEDGTFSDTIKKTGLFFISYVKIQHHYT